MCESVSPTGRMNRRSLLGTAGLAGLGVAVTGAAAATSPSGRLLRGTPLTPLHPLLPTQPGGTVLTLLGTAGGPQADYGRTGTSSVLTVDGYNYLVDTGRSSVTQYLNSGLLFSRLAAMFITHLHADHLADYYNYFLLEGGQPNAEGDRLNLGVPLPVFGPGPAGTLPPTSTPFPTIAPQDPTPGLKDLTTWLTNGYAYSFNLFMRGDGTQDVNFLLSRVTEIAAPSTAGASATYTAPMMDPFPVYEDDRVRVSAVLVPHGAVFPAFAYRFDTAHGAVVFSGDTSCPGLTADTNNVIKLAIGADVLVHEVMDWDFIRTASTLRGDDVAADPLLRHLQASHTTTEQVARVAEAASVPQLVLTHLIPSNPLLVPDLVWKAKCSTGYGGLVHVGNDRDQIRLPVRARP